MQPIKIILFMGGFAGDLVTALHDMECLLNFNQNGKVDILDEKIKLQDNITQKKWSDAEKNNYLGKHKVISCCDTNFAFKNRNKTQVLYCSDDKMSEFFCRRYFNYHPKIAKNKSFEEYFANFKEWNKNWPGKFKFKVDVANIFNDDFLDQIGIVKSPKKLELWQNWRAINRKNFSIHTDESCL